MREGVNAPVPLLITSWAACWRDDACAYKGKRDKMGEFYWPATQTRLNKPLEKIGSTLTPTGVTSVPVKTTRMLTRTPLSTRAGRRLWRPSQPFCLYRASTSRLQWSIHNTSIFLRLRPLPGFLEDCDPSSCCPTPSTLLLNACCSSIMILK